MKIHEYQAKEILRKHGVSTLESRVCFTLDQVMKSADELGFPCVIKAQIHAGGRGKGGGVKLAKNKDEAHLHGKNILGMQLVTPQTGPEGQLVNSVLVEQGCQIEKELYVGVLLDRDKDRVCVMASTEGGVDIEEVAAHHPEKILKEWADPVVGLSAYQARNLAYGLGLPEEVTKKVVRFLISLYNASVDTDASLTEINPLVVSKGGDVIALDAKMNFDDNALYRQKAVVGMQDPSQEDPRELMAQHHGLSYIALDGNIGCMVNGAGLAMATMDIIKHVGGEPANFLDVGGSATQEKVTEALKIILQDTAVKAVLINVFGGIAKCDVIAAGVVAAVKELGLHVPLVVRLEGTNVTAGKEILRQSGLAIIPADDLLDGAKKAVAAAAGH
jgi:succinyl-CoA synthetase beta subunit